MNPPDRASSHATRERMLVAAAQLVAEGGWDVATTRAVAERADVNKALVHYHFGTIEDLLVEAVEHVFKDEVTTGMARILAHEDPADGLDDIAEWLVTHPLPENGRILVEALGRAMINDRIRASFAPALADFRAELTIRLAATGSENAAELAVAVAGMLDGVAIHRAVDPTVDAASAVRRIADLIRQARA